MCGCNSAANGRMGGANGGVGGVLEKEGCANIGETQKEGDEDLVERERATAQVAPSLTSSRHHLNGVKQLVSLSMDSYNSMEYNNNIKRHRRAGRKSSVHSCLWINPTACMNPETELYTCSYMH